MHSLYIHFPFCKNKCGYCSFYSITNIAFMDDYLNALDFELLWYSQRYRDIKTIYIGGGTPSMMSSSQISRLLLSIRSKFNLRPDSEITVECNPESVNKEKIEAFCDAGVNRISLGVQSFDNNVLKNIGRIHDSTSAMNAIEMINNSGIENLNCDIMFGLPGQTPDILYDDLNKLVEYDINHVSVYGLSLDETVPLYAKYKSAQFVMIDDDTYYDMYFDIDNILKKYGLNKYEISNFAKKGYESIHNLSYWDYEEFIGIGCGAFGMLNGIRYHNMHDLDSYISGEFERQEEILSEETQLSEAIFMGLRKSEGIFFSKIFSRFGVDIKTKYSDVFDELIKKGLIELKEDNCALTYKGMVLSNEVFVKFV